MKSRTSFFNATVLRKDITRFAPLWGLYLAGMLLICLGGFFRDETGAVLADTMGTTIGVFSVVNFAYALVCGELLFGDLFNSRLCNALHAMPLRREGWFVTHLVSGILFSLVPNLVVALCLIPQLGSCYWFVSLIWLGGMTVTYLFCFSAAVLSAMCTGNRFAMVLIYGLINFLSILALWLLKFLYAPLLYGINIDSSPFVFLSPISYLCVTELYFLGPLDQISYAYETNGWPYLMGMAVVGVVMLAVALLLYRRRNLEAAGDFITVRFLSPVFQVLYTLTAGVVVFLFSYVVGVGEDYLFLVVGIVAGFVTGQMLLKRTVKVFRPSMFIGLIVMVVLLFGSLGVTRLDLFGIVRWTPEPGQIESVSVRHNYSGYAYTTVDADEIEELTEIHQQLIEEGMGQQHYPVVTTVELSYTLNNGTTVIRSYSVSRKLSKTIATWFSRPEYVLRTDDVASLPEKVKYIECGIYDDNASSYLFVDEEAKELLEAVISDCKAGNMLQDWYYYNDGVELGWLTIELQENGSIHLAVWDSCCDTVAWLEEHGVTY